MSRGPRLDYPGALHHVIVRGIERRRILRTDPRPLSCFRAQGEGSAQGLGIRYLMWQQIGVGKVRRGNYLFVTWKGDHGPRHVHVYRDGKLVVKWNLDDRVPMKGRPTTRVLQLIAELETEGIL